MTIWIWVIGALYAVLLAGLAFEAWRRTTSGEDYILAGSSVGSVVGLFTYAATLFSTFTLMGMPDFFRSHGVGAWIFLAVSDGVQIFLVVWFGYHIRKQAQKKGYRGTAGLLGDLFGNIWAGYVYFGGIFVFLIPYVAIQIRGLAIFLEAVFPGALPAWAWSTTIVAVMLVYSEVGGLRAIMYSDVVQGLTLLAVTWVIAISYLHDFGGVGSMFQAVEQVEAELLSAPGPEGLFSRQFLIASFLAIVLLPATQPQLTTRLMILKDRATMNRMAVSIGVFAILILLPVIVIGMYGALEYPDASVRDFLSNALLFDQPDFVGAVVVVGLLAAAMSTADSQIFALGTELQSLFSGGEEAAMRKTKIAVWAFGIATLIFSILASDQLVLLARVSFAGTSLLAPMVISGVLSKHPPGIEVIGATAVGLLLFLGAKLAFIPETILGVRMDLLLLLSLAAITVASYAYHRRREAVAAE
jgi:SSS family solute:Na+ symporter